MSDSGTERRGPEWQILGHLGGCLAGKRSSSSCRTRTADRGLDHLTSRRTDASYRRSRRRGAVCGSRRVSAGLRQTSESFEGVGRNSSTVEARVLAAKRSGEVVCTEAQFNSTAVHFVGLCNGYLTPMVYQIIETAWGFWPRDSLSRRRRNQPIAFASCRGRQKHRELVALRSAALAKLPAVLQSPRVPGTLTSRNAARDPVPPKAVPLPTGGRG
jgi:hypothetical protein